MGLFDGLFNGDQKANSGASASNIRIVGKDGFAYQATELTKKEAKEYQKKADKTSRRSIWND